MSQATATGHQAIPAPRGVQNSATKTGGEMPQEIKTISLSLPYHLGSVNCYLIETGNGYILIDNGFDAKVLSIPGHSKGSVGILTAGGDLFCGDLLINIDKPVLNDIIDDSVAANASVERLKSLNLHTVYPGHGKPFPMELFIKNNQ